MNAFWDFMEIGWATKCPQGWWQAEESLDTYWLKWLHSRSLAAIDWRAGKKKQGTRRRKGRGPKEAGRPMKGDLWLAFLLILWTSGVFLVVARNLILTSTRFFFLQLLWLISVIAKFAFFFPPATAWPEFGTITTKSWCERLHTVLKSMPSSELIMFSPNRNIWFK